MFRSRRADPSEAISLLATPSGPADGGRRPFRSLGFILSAVFLIGVVVIGGGRILFYGGSGDAPAVAAPAADPVQADRCPDYPGAPPPLPATGADHEWVQVGKVLAPQSVQLGPVRPDPARGCWAPGPAGALAAAANWMAAMTDPAQVLDTVLTQTGPGPGRDRLVQLLNTPSPDGRSVLVSAADQRGDFWFVGWRLLSEAPDRVTVSLAYTAPERALAAAAVTVVRDEGRNDWLILPPPSGRMGDVIDPSVPSMTGYTDWSAR